MTFEQPKVKRLPARGWLAKSIADAQRWYAIPENKKWADAVRANWKQND